MAPSSCRIANPQQSGCRTDTRAIHSPLILESLWHAFLRCSLQLQLHLPRPTAAEARIINRQRTYRCIRTWPVLLLKLARVSRATCTWNCLESLEFCPRKPGFSQGTAIFCDGSFPNDGSHRCSIDPPRAGSICQQLHSSSEAQLPDDPHWLFRRPKFRGSRSHSHSAPAIGVPETLEVLTEPPSTLATCRESNLYCADPAKISVFSDDPSN